jgi:hypothetical protein
VRNRGEIMGKDSWGEKNVYESKKRILRKDPAEKYEEEIEKE